MTSLHQKDHDRALSDPARVEALRSTGLLEAPLPAPEFTRLTQRAARLLGTRAACLTLVDADRQVTLGAFGQDPPHADEQERLWNRVCRYVVATGVPLVVPNARADPGDHPGLAETGDMAYLGVPLRDADSHALGALCVADVAPREWSDEDLAALGDLAAQTVREMELQTEVARRRRLLTELRADERTAECDALLAETQHMASIGSWVFDARSGEITWTEEMYRLHGVEPGAAPIRWGAYVKCVHVDDRAALRVAMSHTLATGEPFTEDYRIVRHDDSVRSLHARARAERDVSGLVVRVLGMCQDVTDRLQTLAALRRSEERYRLSAAATSDIVYDHDVVEGTVHRTGAAAVLLGYTISDLEPTIDAWRALVHVEDREQMDATIRTALRSPATNGFSCEYRVRQRDGRYAFVADRGAIVRNALGAPCRVVGTIADLTEQRATEEALRASEARLRLALSVGGMFVWERDLASDKVRQGMLPSGGPDAAVAADELRDYADFLDAVHPEDRQQVARANADAVTRRGEFSVEYRVLSAHGAVNWHQTVGRVISGSDGQPSRVVGVSLDVTGRRTLEGQLQQAQRMEAVGRLAGGVAHDFSNLITVISASTMFARAEVPPRTLVAFELDQIDEASRRAADLTRQLLAFSRKQVLRPQRVEVNERIAGLEILLRRVLGEDVRIETQLTTPVWPVYVDPGQLEQVLMNLVVNARDAMPAGGTVRITTANVHVDDRMARSMAGLTTGRYVSVAIADTGHGIPADLLPHIFEPFVTTKGPGAGTGLGLPMVYGIVKQSGGYVDVQSTPGEGTTFTLLLPRDADDTTPAGLAPARPPAAGGRETVLLVEDEAAVRSALARVLARHGYNVVEAADGEEALREWHAHRTEGEQVSDRGSGGVPHLTGIDVVLTDLVMPVLGGRVLVERLRAEQPDARIIIMTGYTADTAGIQALLADGDRSAFLPKPITPGDLLRAIRNVLTCPADRA